MYYRTQKESSYKLSGTHDLRTPPCLHRWILIVDLKRDTRENCTNSDFTQHSRQWGPPAGLLNTSQGYWRENYMTTITTQQQPKSIADPSPTPTNTNPESGIVSVFFFFFPFQIEDAFGNICSWKRKNTMPSNSDCPWASEDTMHSHKRVFIQPCLAWVRLSWRIWITSIRNDQKLFSE